MGMLTKLYQSSCDDATPEPEATDPAFQAEFPTIWEFISCVEVDGQPRLPGKLQVTCENALIKVSLVDQQRKAVYGLSGNAVMTTLAELEHRCMNDQVEWYFWERKRPTSGGRAKRPGGRSGSSRKAG